VGFVLFMVDALLTGAYVALQFTNSEWLIDQVDEVANRVRRLRLLRKHHPELLRTAKRIPVRLLAQESFTAKHKRGTYDSRGLLFLTEDAVMYWDLGQSTRLEPYVFRVNDSIAILHRSEPYRKGEHMWIQLEADGSARYLQCEEAPANETTQALFEQISAVLHESPTSA
jgi:hypothetical protein